MAWSASLNELFTAWLVSVSTLPRHAPTRKQAQIQIDVTSSFPGTRNAKNQECQEPVGPSRTSRNSPTISNRHCCCHQPSGAIGSCHKASSGQSCHPFIGDQCGRSLKHDFSQIQLAYWRIPAQDLQPSILMLILSRPSNEMQLPINTGLAYDTMFGALD